MKLDGSYQLWLPGFEHRWQAKKLDTPQQRDYWTFLEETAKEVAAMPA